MEPISKKYLAVLLGLIFSSMALIVLVNWRIDPLQFYRKASYPPYLIEQKRFQNPGLARNYDYDTVVIGTSLSENFHHKSAQEKLGFNLLNLAMKGASAREQRLMLEVALRTGKVKNVIWEINYEYLRGTTNWVANFDGSFPEHFYDGNPLNEISNYLLNLDTTKGSLKILLTKCGVRAYHNQNLEKLYTWDDKRKFGRESVERAWHKAAKDRSLYINLNPIASFSTAKLNANFDANVLEIVRAHPGVNFYLFFPAFSVGHYAFMNSVDPEIFAHMLDNKRHIFQSTRGLVNVQLFNFQDAAIISDVANYCDLVHYNGAFNDYMLDSFREHRHLAAVDDPENLKLAVSDKKISEWIEKSFPPVPAPANGNVRINN